MKDIKFLRQELLQIKAQKAEKTDLSLEKMLCTGTTKLIGNQNKSAFETSSANSATMPENTVFDYEKLQTIFMDEGVNALLKELQNLAANGGVTDIKVNTDTETRKTTGVPDDTPVL